MREQEFRIELFVFPDGTEIEMLVFEKPAERSACGGARDCAPGDRRREAPGRAAAAGAAPEPGRQPHVCPVCHGELVYPVDWQRTSDTAWKLRLRCPECETERDAVLGRADVEDFNRRLYCGSQELAQAAQETGRRNFQEEATKLVAALEMGVILPMDF